MNVLLDKIKSGKIPLRDGYHFYWTAALGGEISGFIQTPEFTVMPKTHGWWRTDDPQKAAKLAEQLYLKENADGESQNS